MELVELERYELFADEKSVKINTYQTMLGNRYQSRETNLFFLPHFHALTDLDGMTKNDLRKMLVERWDKPRQVLVRSLTQSELFKGEIVKHKIETAFHRIASYCYNGSNAELRFSDTWLKNEDCWDKDIETFVRENSDDGASPHQLSFQHIKLLVSAHNKMTNNGANLLKVCIR